VSGPSESAHGESTKVIFIALAANLGIAVAKFVGAFITGSASLLAEAIHSVVDCSNQVLLVVGNKKSRKPPDAAHPLGYGREAFFWSFIVALLLFSLGGLFAIYEGVHKLEHHEAASSPKLAFGVLVFSFLLEAYSFYACLKQVRANSTHGSLWDWYRHSKNSELLVIFTEDAAALAGLFVAAVCLGLFWMTGETYWDALGSIFVGVILGIVAILLAVEIKSFIIGEASDRTLQRFVTDTVPTLFSGGHVLHFISLQTGSNEVMYSCKIHPGAVRDVQQAIDLVNQLERMTKARFAEVKWQFVELDSKD
jgi:cation diffusion facilitator family transporter